MPRQKDKRRQEDRRRRRRDARQRRVEAAASQRVWLAAVGDVDLQAAGDGDDGPPKFEMTVYGGGKMKPQGFYWDVVVDLQGLRAMRGKLPSFIDHDRKQIVGHTTKVDIDRENQVVTAVGVVSGATPYAQQVIDSAGNGFPWKSSMGAAIKERRFVEAGQTVAVNGKRFRGPLLLIESAVIYENSFVSVAGDPSSRSRIAASAAQLMEGLPMPFDEWLKAKGFDPNEISDQQRSTLQAAYDTDADDTEPDDADDAPPDAPGAGGRSATDRRLRAHGRAEDLPTADELLASTRETMAGETDRVADIRRICAQYGVDQVTVDGKKVNLEAHAIREGWDHAKTELEAMRGGRPQTGPAIHTPDNTLHAAGAFEAALCVAGGLGEDLAAEGVSDQAMDLAASREYRGVGIHALMHETIRAAGGYSRPGQVDNDFIRTALTADRDLQAAGNATTSLSTVLGNVGNKSLLRAYRAVPDVVHEFCDRQSNRDFKPATRIRLTGDAIFKEVGADGDLKSFELGEENYTNALKTFGRIISLNRQMMINDDLGAFLQLPRVLGRGAGLARNKAVFELLFASVGTFFSAANNNYLEGAATALSIEALTAAEKLFLEQTDADGNPIEVMPAGLLHGPGNKVLAEQLYSDRFVNETTTANKPKTSGNPHGGKFKPVHSAWMSSAKVANASQTGWMLYGDPNDVPVMEVAYLNGRETPVAESSEADFDQLGMKWRSYWDFSAAMANTTGGVFVKGAA